MLAFQFPVLMSNVICMRRAIQMNDFTKEELDMMYDKKTVAYILSSNRRSFKEYCTCGGYSKQIIRHMPYCPQEEEVQEWAKDNFYE
jgi:hypothetical protein